jgi:hypothetical protein
VRLEAERLLLVLRDRVLEPLRPLDPDRVDPDLLDLDVDVLLLRDPGGEDVRVAMVTTLGPSHTSHTDHTLRVVGRSGGGRPGPDAFRGNRAVAKNFPPVLYPGPACP